MSFFDKIKSVLTSSSDCGAGTSARHLSAPVPQSSSHPRIWPLSPLMQQEMKKGVVFNMKVVLRGLRGVGKSTLLARLCGYPAPHAYTPSEAISAGTIRIRGAGCAPHEGTKVDIWDVVDEGGGSRSEASAAPLKKTTLSKMSSNEVDMLTTVADARSIDVYKDCQLAAFVVDCRRRESLAYVTREAARVPITTSILIVLNFIDIPAELREVDAQMVAAVCNSLRRTTSSLTARVLDHTSPPPHEFSTAPTWIQCSARLGHGIQDFIHALNTPNVYLRIAVLEGRIRQLFQQISSEPHSAPPPSCPSASAAAAVLPPPEAPLKIANTVYNVRSGPQPAAGALALERAPRDSVDANGISIGFFDATSEEEDEEMKADTANFNVNPPLTLQTPDNHSSHTPSSVMNTLQPAGDHFCATPFHNNSEIHETSRAMAAVSPPSPSSSSLPGAAQLTTPTPDVATMVADVAGPPDAFFIAADERTSPHNNEVTSSQRSTSSSAPLYTDETRRPLASQSVSWHANRAAPQASVGNSSSAKVAVDAADVKRLAEQMKLAFAEEAVGSLPDSTSFESEVPSSTGAMSRHAERTHRRKHRKDTAERDRGTTNKQKKTKDGEHTRKSSKRCERTKTSSEPGVDDSFEVVTA